MNAKTEDGETPLHWAAWHNNIEVVKLLIIKGADANIRSKSKGTPLDFARLQNNTHVSEYLSSLK